MKLKTKLLHTSLNDVFIDIYFFPRIKQRTGRYENMQSISLTAVYELLQLMVNNNEGAEYTQRRAEVVWEMIYYRRPQLHLTCSWVITSLYNCGGHTTLVNQVFSSVKKCLAGRDIVKKELLTSPC